MWTCRGSTKKKKKEREGPEVGRYKGKKRGGGSLKKHAAIVLKHAGPASRSASLCNAGTRGQGEEGSAYEEEQEEEEVSFSDL